MCIRDRHRGIDIAVPVGGQVKAPFGGIVSKVNTFYEGDYETQYVEITTDNNYVMRFAYVKPGKNIKEGERLEAGQTFGVMRRPTSEAAGWDMSISDHVHVEVVEGKEFKRNKRIDPTELLGVVR